MLGISLCAEDRHAWLKGVVVARRNVCTWKISRIVLVVMACEALNILLLPGIKFLDISIILYHRKTWISRIKVNSFLIKESNFSDLMFYIVALLFQYWMCSFMSSKVRRLSESFMASRVRTYIGFFSSVSPQMSSQIEVKWKALSTLFALVRLFSLKM
jgi:hypothetical protein